MHADVGVGARRAVAETDVCAGIIAVGYAAGLYALDLEVSDLGG